MSSATVSRKVLDEARNKRNRSVFLRDIIVIRLINAWWIATFFQPDEFFQSLEPAWDLAFGSRSGAWLTWEWKHQLRTSLHPALFAGVYLIADFISSRILPIGILRAAILVAAPKALQAVIAGLGDWYTWQLAVSIYGANSNVSFFALFLQLFNPWQWYCSTRTFSNSLETTLTVMALYYWPWELVSAAQTTKENPKPTPVLKSLWSLRASLCLAALAVVLRPTNVLIWATIVFFTLTRISLQGSSPLTISTVFALIREAILCGSLILVISIASDRLYFGFWTFPAYNFLNFNLSKSLAVFYGRNPWHYYILQGLPLICTTSLPFAIMALYKSSAFASSTSQSNTLKTLAYTVFTTIGALSLISHKEVRFIYPLLPALSILSAPVAASFFTFQPDATTNNPRPRPQIRNKHYLLAALGVNVFLAGYLSFFHQTAPLNVLTYLRHEYERIHPDSVQLAQTSRFSVGPGKDEELFALFLMPCHSTPWRSHLVYPGLRAYALTCEPPLHTEPNTRERENYRDEADRFYDNPIPFLTSELFGPEKPLAVPRYIVGFDGIEPWLQDFVKTPEAQALSLTQVRPVWKGFNGLFNEDWRRSGKMIVWDTGIYDNAPPAKKS
ncbi:GPI mannosyltransferase 3 [Fusarium oxysporum f. sp. raphani 54005]|uniref:Mannosyltransferase n=3 Tax=Fusarium oxysporum f. sp. raphani TaxID=96318 RepID=X0CKY8_FUSOX|nr:GPI mannosyltransferase 3 [Fusarium oxysporum f. sp. raphani 54005]KAG7433413.1 GPI mannosyltransferase 3 [Fusarium oxysporum f. sp. raphani]KAJ4038819.1 glycosylphosphatidylinositol anchor biosynthesis [Fusarium oxysporum]EXK95105.1 GPI mannosyltransferase 3 [Fusarium oxysporum f. sp. raphani 54005]EXK95106.1 GPI mannosyltransferase 3 [Fusarium oxysporum f. sp. raphani 54005]